MVFFFKEKKAKAMDFYKSDSIPNNYDFDLKNSTFINYYLHKI